MSLPLQVCSNCEAAQYPARAVCRRCLCDRLVQRADPGLGVVLAQARVEVSFDPAWAAALPCRVGTVLLDAGVQVMALLANDATRGSRVVVAPAPGPTDAVLLAARLAEPGA